MDNLAADFTIENNEPLSADYTLSDNTIACNFEIYASGTVWGSIAGDINNQTDLINILNDKVDLTSFNDLSNTVTNNYNELSDDISDLTGTVTDNYNALSGQISDLSGVVDDNYTSLDNRLTTTEGSVLNLTDAVGNISDDVTNIQNTINSYGDIVTYNAANFATSAQGTLADTALQPNDNISELVNDVGYITSASLPTVNNATITIQKNGSSVGTFTLNQANNDTLNITVPTQASDIGAMPDTTTIEDLTTTAQLNALNSGATTSNIGQITTNQNNIADIRSLIPLQASTSNQLADKGFVNSSIATNTANFIGTFNSVAELEAYSGTLTNNDYAFVATTDSAGNTLYDRYKYNADTQEWLFEYELNNSSFTAQQWESINSGITSGDVALIGTALQPNDNISALTNDAGYITSASLPTVNNATLTIQKNGTTVNTFTANSSTNATANIIVPTDTLDLTNGAGYITGITSSDVTTALGYTPYNSTNPNGYITGITGTDVTNALGFTPYDASNPNGYTSNIGTVTSVNNIAPISGNVTISIPTDTADLTNGAGFITSADLPTNYVTTDTTQTITARKTFTGEKAIYFKQVATTNKLGFTLYNPSNTELGALEYRPNTISSASLLTINCPQATGGYVGFRYWGSPAVNIVAPKVATAGNYYIPTHITNGSTTVTASNTGTVNISTLLPTIPTVGNGTITINQGGTQKGTFTVNQSGDTTINLDAGGGTVDQTFDGTSQNAQSGVAINGAGFLKNNATGTNSINILGVSNNYNYQTAIGSHAKAYLHSVAVGYSSLAGAYCVAVGSEAVASGNDESIAIGKNAEVTFDGNYSIQLGNGTNSTPYSFAIGFNGTNYQLLDGTTGLIPDARISSNIARTNQIPTPIYDSVNERITF